MKENSLSMCRSKYSVNEQLYLETFYKLFLIISGNIVPVD